MRRADFLSISLTTKLLDVQIAAFRKMYRDAYQTLVTSRADVVEQLELYYKEEVAKVEAKLADDERMRKEVLPVVIHAFDQAVGIAVLALEYRVEAQELSPMGAALPVTAEGRPTELFRKVLEQHLWKVDDAESFFADVVRWFHEALQKFPQHFSATRWKLVVRDNELQVELTGVKPKSGAEPHLALGWTPCIDQKDN